MAVDGVVSDAASDGSLLYIVEFDDGERLTDVREDELHDLQAKSAVPARDQHVEGRDSLARDRAHRGRA